MATIEISSALAALSQPSTLSIHALAEPILSNPDTSTRDRTSTSSTSDIPPTGLSPTALEAELTHYKDLFSKLRFSYVEQVTKERFLKSIVADPPEPVDAHENEVLERQLLQEKAALKARKEDVAVRMEQLERAGRDVVRREYRNTYSTVYMTCDGR